MRPEGAVPNQNVQGSRAGVGHGVAAGAAQQGRIPQMRQRDVLRVPEPPVNLQIFFTGASITLTAFAIGSATGVVSYATFEIANSLVMTACLARGLYYLAYET